MPQIRLQQVFRCLATERSRVQVIGGSPALKVSIAGGSVRYTDSETSDSECECGSLSSGVCERVLSACASSSSLGSQLKMLFEIWIWRSLDASEPSWLQMPGRRELLEISAFCPPCWRAVCVTC